MLLLLLGYLIGSLPTGYLVGRIKGVDIRKVGSGNIGATNVLRVLGVKLGVLVLLIDICKGILACFLGAYLLQQISTQTALVPVKITTDPALVLLLGGIGAILGHSFTCWLKFRGGKGVATTAGVFLAVVPIPTAIVVGIFLLVTWISRYVSLGSICAAIALPLCVYFFHASTALIVLTTLCAIVVIVRHKSNIRRLIAGTENKIGAKSK